MDEKKKEFVKPVKPISNAILIKGGKLDGMYEIIPSKSYILKINAIKNQELVKGVKTYVRASSLSVLKANKII